MIIKSRLAFTLMEILVVVTLLVALAIALLVTLNPWTQINKSQDSKRKQELTQLSKTLEDYYNDKNCYPKPLDICYPNNQSGYNPQIDNKCYICGNQTGSPTFSPYLSQLPCDPRHPNKKYLYQVDNNNCPDLYYIYSFLTNTSDPSTREYCSNDGTGETDYNWGVSSSNTQPRINCSDTVNPTNTPVPPSLTPTQTISQSPTQIPTPSPTPVSSGQSCASFSSFYIVSNNICNICGDYSRCQLYYPNNEYYVINSICTITCIKY